ncbi:hypothetical protein C5N14_28265 [Micromonospora sp. MW-13]|nr:hypothetical protein C5N14_28265 [Micromonospora sp. MW-13]
MIGPAEERAYEILVGRPGATLAELAPLWPGPAPLAVALARLEAAGLASVLPGSPARYAANATDTAVQLLDDREAALERVHEHIGHLTDAYRNARAGGKSHVVELITGRLAVRQAVTHVHRSAHQELCCFETGPFSHRAGVDGIDPVSAAVPCRRVYDRAAVEESGGLAAIEDLIRAGEQVRVVSELPVRLYLADQLAVLPLPDGGESGGGERAIIVHPCSLLDALRKLFDTLWDRAVPLHLPNGRQRTATVLDEDRLIMLLLSGLTDEAIARQIGVGARTVQRRIAVLMSELGAHTRFQAGVQAALRQRRTGDEDNAEALSRRNLGLGSA